MGSRVNLRTAAIAAVCAIALMALAWYATSRADTETPTAVVPAGSTPVDKASDEVDLPPLPKTP